MIVTVLRSGGDFRPEHVERLRLQCEIYAPDEPFVCLTDYPNVTGGRPLIFEWSGWWSKMEVFALLGPILYMDLDTTIVGDLAPLLEVAHSMPFTALRDFNPHVREMGSGLMAWSGDMRRVFLEFEADPDFHMAECTTPAKWGDQGFIEPLTPNRAYWQDLLPDAVVSYKKHCMDGVPAGARVVCHHGPPRPWEV